MPIFEFRCQACQKEFEEFTSYNQIKTVTCPKCKSKKIDKQISRLGGIQMGKAAPSSCPVAQGCPSAQTCGPRGGCGFDA